MEQSPSSETNSYSASKEIPCLLWSLNVHYHVHKIPPLVPILSHMNPVHTVRKIHLGDLGSIPGRGRDFFSLPLRPDVLWGPRYPKKFSRE